MAENEKTIWLGLSALLFTALAWGLMGAIIAFMVYAQLYFPGGVDSISDESPAAISVGLLFLASAPLNLVGLALSIFGLFRKKENKLFCGVGLVMSLGLFVLIAVVIAFAIYEAMSSEV